MDSNDRSTIPAIDFTALHDHGILVIEQLASKADHEGWDVYAEGAHAVPDSLYVGVRPSMEGVVFTSVRVLNSSPSETWREPDRDGLTQIFSGRLQVPGGVLLVGDSDANVEIRLPVTSGTAGVTVYVDVVGLAARVIVLLDPNPFA